MSPNEITVLGGLVIGLVFGAIAQSSGFCLNRAIRDRVSQHNSHKLRSFLLALAVAIIGTQWMHHSGNIHLAQSIYLSHQFSWFLIPFGGLLFGWGMILSRGCGARTLVLLGQGNMRSFVVALSLGVSAYMTLTGLLGPLRNALTASTLVSIPSVNIQDRWIMAFMVLALLFYVFKDKGFLKQSRDVISGVVVGLLVVAGWWVTGSLGFDEFATNAVGSVGSITFVAPIGSTIQYIMISTGLTLSFGVTLVLGVVLGSFVWARITRTHKFEGFRSQEEIRRYVIGGICMGIGGALAMGCSIGQGLTGLSTLSYVSMLSVSSIVVGSWMALKKGF